MLETYGEARPRQTLDTWAWFGESHGAGDQGLGRRENDILKQEPEDVVLMQSLLSGNPLNLSVHMNFR